VRGWQGLIICAAGGRLAHLSSVARELRCTVLLIDDALSKLQCARELSIDLEEGQLYVCPSALEIVSATSRER
jgi:phosphoenolpyruvate-protein kinase (PTS system EI component)